MGFQWNASNNGILFARYMGLEVYRTSGVRGPTVLMFSIVLDYIIKNIRTCIKTITFSSNIIFLMHKSIHSKLMCKYFLVIYLIKFCINKLKITS